jgi:hypothetical protein
MSICKPNCVTGLPAFGAIDDCDIQSLLTSGEVAQVIFTKCNLDWVDVDDPTEWETNIQATDVSIPFVGNGKIDEQTESGELRIGCTTISTICKKPFEFTSPIADTTSQTEWSLYNEIQKQRLGLSVAFLTCDGILLIDPDWVTGEPIGIKLSMLKISQIFSGEADGKMTYKINGEVSECRSLKRVKLSADTLAVITANNPGS